MRTKEQILLAIDEKLELADRLGFSHPAYDSILKVVDMLFNEIKKIEVLKNEKNN